ncbi:MAG: glycosyltransferase, partial [Elusimicrobiaceae bacterium]|nr:glycosyltransferase [Elusimicrobiaceae bacterium]
MDRIVVVKQVNDVHTPLLNQMLVTEYIKNYDFDAHITAGCDLYGLMRNTDIYVNSAREAEGLNELLDAMASKLPVVATNVKGADELVQDRVNGLLVNAGDEESLQAALDELMVNWGHRVGLAVEAARLKERYPFEVFMAFFEQDS